MADRYRPQAIESKWQKKWEETGLYRTVEDPGRQKWYFLTMLPYPSGDLHIGHWYAMTPSDTGARYKRMQGYNVFFPIGFDAFGLPAENAAIKHNVHPSKWTYANIERMRQQLRSMGAMWAWDHEAVSCDPEYYRWTQWFFLKLYDMGLAYREYAPVDWCPNCNTTLAREQVWGDDRHCERCGTPVIKKNLNQWFFRITNYADELLDFSKIQWPERVETMQTNWIGRSEGAEVIFRTAAESGGQALPVFTTRPDTLWGATFMVLAPEHPLVDQITTAEYREAVEAYKLQAARASDIERTTAEREKTGLFTGAYAINPVNGERIPIWLADYVLMAYGTGAIMAVPAHDERDFEFALKFGLPIIPVIARPDDLAKSFVPKGAFDPAMVEALGAAGIPLEERDGSLYVTMTGEQADRYVELAQKYTRPGKWIEVVGARWVFVFENGVRELDSVEADRDILIRCQALDASVRGNRTVMEMLWSLEFYRDALYHDAYGTMIASGPFTGTPGDVAKQKVTAWLEERGTGKARVNYRLHDWLISRQRMWGAPIPMIYCEKCGTVPVPYADLPVLLPDDAEFRPTGESPLKYHEGFRYVQCPQCGGDAERETDTMDTFMCSSWYQYAYVTPYYKTGEKIHAADVPWDPAQGRYWLPVDQYTGGIEHATMHLMYTRFFTKAMRDMGLVWFDEPMVRLFNQGLILGEDNEKMSKSRGNVVAPDNLVARYGADSVRMYLMFIGPWEQGGPWSSTGIEGVYRFFNRLWAVVTEPKPAPQTAPAESETRALRRKTHQTIRRVSEDIDGFHFNTAVAALMELNNTLIKAKETPVYATPAWDEAVQSLLLLLAPIAPHVTEELWAFLGRPYSIHEQRWPAWDPDVAKEDVITLVVQINGKVRDKLEVPADVTEEQARALALEAPAVKRQLDGQKPIKVVYVPGKLVNIVAR